MNRSPASGSFDIERDRYSFDLVIEALFRFKASFAAVKLYPPSSEPAEMSIRKFYSVLIKIFDRADLLVINESENDILINGKLIKTGNLATDKKEAVKGAAEILSSLNIRNITFRCGLAMRELTVFMSALAGKSSREARVETAVREQLKKNGVEHIKVNERIYRPVDSDDMVVSGAKDHFEKNRGALDELMKVIQEINEMKLMTSGGTIRDETKMEIAEKLFSLKPELLSQFLNKKTGARDAVADKMNTSLTQPQLKETVFRLISSYRHLKALSPQISSDGKLDNIKNTVRFMIDCFKDRGMALEICRELLNSNLDELVPPPVDMWKSSASFSFRRAHEILEKDSLAIIGGDVREELPEIFKALDAAGEDEVIKKLVEKILDDLQADTLAVRSSAILLMKKLYGVFDLISNKSSETLFIAIREQSVKERDEEIYQEISSILLKKAQQYIRRKEYGKALPVIEMYRRNTEEKTPDFVKRPEYAEGFLKGIASSDAAEIVLQDLDSPDRDIRENTRRITVALGAFIVPALVESIKECENFSQRMYMVSLLKEIGGDALSYMAGEFERETSTEKLKRLVQVLPALESASLAFSYLKKALTHPDRRVRVEAVLTLPRIHSEDDRKGRFLMQSLQDRDDLVRREVIRMFGELEYEPAVEELINIVSPKTLSSKGESDMIRQAACMALASIGDKRAVEPLISIIEKPKWYSFSFRRQSGVVKISAIQALKHFSGHAIERALENALRDKDRFVRAAAESALEKK